ncbi:7,8-dihydro-6-hydroxymethylpterin dimethyltransferase [Methanonatronarchaeum thermophilum]|uniref:7,8-dihydro-6-hydroxymethylpterin dimethyltransferase n=1 Tax=Methanonatronarchaeum thermophilum TaxID=1927129 RepID=A0A1Y3GJD7_9EURY|nr:radical SAM protein [Methanonatronarchaeum thermophilum]OUJ19506.1 7,8-dihydro-6-hydroxymethylpterin dimethyltransferase [Methanonatronarchaeum thermophilum]
MLPKKTKSICPECKEVVEAEIRPVNGEVHLFKECSEHGEFSDVYWSDREMFERFNEYCYDGRGVNNPQTVVDHGCPSDCGLCPEHKSHTSLANIDLTNRCNLSCSFCFAHAEARGYVYEPSYETIVEMLRALRKEEPVPTPAVQFSGGEPTLREDLPKIVEKAKEMGFKQVQIATNGIKLGTDPELAKTLKEKELSTAYLHFDGLTEDVEPYLNIKKKAIQNCRKAGLGLVLVPTVIKGKNDDQLFKLIEFAAKNVDIIRGVNFQPIAFTGAASDEKERKNKRFTIPDLTKKLEQQSNQEIKQNDFYPVPSVIPISKVVEAFTEKPQVEFSSHPHCGAATYLFIHNNKITPINRFVDVKKFFQTLNNLANEIETGILFRMSDHLGNGRASKMSENIGKTKAVTKALRRINKTIDKQKQPEGLNFGQKIKRIFKEQNYDAVGDFHWDTLFIGTMHFQDNYNYDLQRTKRCVIHYATPDGQIIPFCAYNSGPTYRQKIEQKHSTPLKKWKEQKGEIEKYQEEKPECSQMKN